MPEYKGWNAHLRTNEDQVIPIETNTTTLLIVHGFRPREIRQHKTAESKLAALQRMDAYQIALVCWPGRWSQDVFLITDPAPLIQRLITFTSEEDDPAWRGGSGIRGSD